MHNHKEVNLEQIVDSLKLKFRSENLQQLIRKSQYYLDTDYACTAIARIILEEARTHEADGRLFDVSTIDDAGHTLVVLDVPNLETVCLNQLPNQVFSCEEAVGTGTDVTNEIMGVDWKKLF